MKEKWERTFCDMWMTSPKTLQTIGELCGAETVIPLPGGARNANFKMINGRETWLLRLFLDPSEGEPKKEADLFRQLKIKALPIPQVFDHGHILIDERSYPYLKMQYLDGVTLSDLLREKGPQALLPTIEKVGEILARIHLITFDDQGFFDDALNIVPLPQEYTFESLLKTNRTLALQFVSEDDLEIIQNILLTLPRTPPCLVHSDFDPSNIFVTDEGPFILDWEFAHSGNRLFDFGNMARFERSSNSPLLSAFLSGYEREGGAIPPDWWRQAKAVDFLNLMWLLSRTDPHTQPHRYASLVGLIKETPQSIGDI